jgi:hypothetical protein
MVGPDVGSGSKYKDEKVRREDRNVDSGGTVMVEDGNCRTVGAEPGFLTIEFRIEDRPGKKFIPGDRIVGGSFRAEIIENDSSSLSGWSCSCSRCRFGLLLLPGKAESSETPFLESSSHKSDCKTHLSWHHGPTYSFLTASRAAETTGPIDA